MEHIKNRDSQSTLSALSIAKIGLLTALIAVCAQITVSFGPVPFTMQIAAVILVALLCSPKEALFSLGLYLSLGAVGLPVFSAFRGSFGMLAGPTGGFLIAFMIAAPLASVARRAMSQKDASLVRALVGDVLAVMIVILVSYVFGAVQFMLVTGTDLVATLGLSVIPFIIPDILKGILALAVARAVRKAVPTMVA